MAHYSRLRIISILVSDLPSSNAENVNYGVECIYLKSVSFKIVECHSQLSCIVYKYIEHILSELIVFL